MRRIGRLSVKFVEYLKQLFLFNQRENTEQSWLSQHGRAVSCIAVLAVTWWASAANQGGELTDRIYRSSSIPCRRCYRLLLSCPGFLSFFWWSRSLTFFSRDFQEWEKRKRERQSWFREKSKIRKFFSFSFSLLLPHRRKTGFSRLLKRLITGVKWNELIASVERACKRKLLRAVFNNSLSYIEIKLKIWLKINYCGKIFFSCIVLLQPQCLLSDLMFLFCLKQLSFFFLFF